MDDFEVYKLYLGLKSHFTSDYDYFKYGGRVQVTPESLEKRRDAYQFKKIAKKYPKKEDVTALFVSNFVAGNTSKWLGFYATEEADDIKTKWEKGLQALSFIFERELKRIKEYMDNDKVEFKDLLSVKDGQHPLLLRYFIASEISLETVILIVDILKLEKIWVTQIKDPVIFPDIIRLIRKYKPFVHYNEQRIKNIIKTVFMLDQKTKE